jgi:hypothetical protein
MVSRRHSNSARPARGPVNVKIGRLNVVNESDEQQRHRPLVCVALQPLATRFCARAHLAVYPKRPSSSCGCQWPHKAAAAVDFAPAALLDSRSLVYVLRQRTHWLCAASCAVIGCALFGRFIDSQSLAVFEIISKSS